MGVGAGSSTGDVAMSGGADASADGGARGGGIGESIRGAAMGRGAGDARGRGARALVAVAEGDALMRTASGPGSRSA